MRHRLCQVPTAARAVRLLLCLAGPAPGIQSLWSILAGHLVFLCSRDSVGGPVELQASWHKASRGPPGFPPAVERRSRRRAPSAAELTRAPGLCLSLGSRCPVTRKDLFSLSPESNLIFTPPHHRDGSHMQSCALLMLGHTCHPVTQSKTNAGCLGTPHTKW